MLPTEFGRKNGSRIKLNLFRGGVSVLRTASTGEPLDATSVRKSILAARVMIVRRWESKRLFCILFFDDSANET